MNAAYYDRAPHPELMRALLARLVTGVTEKNFDGAEWYEGITVDALGEIEAAYREASERAE